MTAAAMLVGCAPDRRIPEPTGVPQETTATSVYFATGRSLVEERVVLSAKGTYKAALEFWLRAVSEEHPGIAIVQPQAKVLSATLKDGTLTIDWSREVLDFEAEPSEKMIALAGILRTMGEFPEIQKVRFTVEGKTSGTVGGKDIEAFWGTVSLKGQPWDVLRRPSQSGSDETTSASE
jgi:spore germination protein GerM